MPNKSVARVFRSRVTLPALQITRNELSKVTRPMTDKELGIDYPTRTDVNMNDLLPRRKTNRRSLRRSERLLQRWKNVNYHNGVDLGLDNYGLPLDRKSSKTNGESQ